MAYREKPKYLSSKQELGDSFLPDRTLPTQSHRASRLVPYLRLHQPNTDLLWRFPKTPSHPVYGPTQAAFPYEWLVLAHASHLLNPLKHATASLSEPLAPVHLLSSPKPGTRGCQPRFTIWLHLGISKPSTSSSHLRLLYSLGRVAPDRTEVGDDLGLHDLGNPRACTPRGQLQTM